MHKMKKILIVDDEPDVNITLRKVLEKNGFIVDSYEDPFLALENFIPHFYDLLILDINMPKMNGLSFYREIRELLTHLDKVMYGEERKLLLITT